MQIPLYRLAPNFSGALLSFIVVVSVLCTAGLHMLLQPMLGPNMVLLLFVPPVVLGTFLGGFRAALLAMALSTLAALALHLRLNGGTFSLSVVEQLRLALFILIGLSISILARQLERSRRALWQSDQRFRILVQGARDIAIFFVSPKGLIESWNEGAAAINGYRDEEIIGQPLSIFFTEEERASGDPARLLRTARHQMHARAEGWRVRKDGTRFWADASLTALHDDAGILIGFVKVIVDRTQQRALLTSLRESEQTSRALLESSMQAVIGIGEDGRIRLVNKTTESMFGYPQSELLGKTLEMLLPESSRGRHVHQRQAFFQNSTPRPMGVGMELRGRRRDGSVFPIEASLSITDTPSGPLAVSFVTDISRRKEIEIALTRERSQLKSILNYSPVLVSIRDLDGRYTVVNRTQCELVGRKESEILGRRASEIFPAETAACIEEDDNAVLSSASIVSSEATLVHANGEERSYLTIKYPLSDLDTGEPFGVCTFSLDITEQKLAEMKALHAAQHDQLTGLPNRALLYEFGARLVSSAERSRTRLAVLFFDLDRFKPINDTYGHEVGDKMLQEVANRLRKGLRSSDVIGRLGGDEFIAILNDIRSDTHVAQIATSLLDSLRQPYFVGALELRTSPSIGVSLYPGEGRDIDTLIRHADAAMYHAKANGRNTYQFFTPDINVNTQRVFALEQRLRQSINENDFELFYQPVIDTRTQRLVSAEALLRWRQKNNDIVLPGEFIAAAETSGLINQLGKWVIERAIQQHEQWRHQGLPPLRSAVNVSPLQFRSKHFQEEVARALADSGIDPLCLELEVTESTVMKQVEEASNTLSALKRLGVRISLDDFGTGYSSLSHLSQLPIDKLKVDQSFIRNIDTNSRSLAITETVIALGKKLGVEVVAEGIESAHALEILAERDCDLGQGYLISPPLSADDFVAWYERHAGAQACAA